MTRGISVRAVVLVVGLAASGVCGAKGAMAAVQRSFHVAPQGDDANPGTQDKPFATLGRARDAVRQVNGVMTGDIEVVLAGGTYRLTRSWVLEPCDSGRGEHRIVYRSAAGQTAVISGGHLVVGWQPDAEGRWKAAAPVEDFRQLYVGGRRATRARGPLPGGRRVGDEGYRTSAAGMADWRNKGDVEFCYEVVWCHTRCKVADIRRQDDGATITMLQPQFRWALDKEGVRIDMPAWIENALELLDEPGEWYLDRASGTVYCRPLPREDLKRVEVVVPGVERLVELRGTLDAPVRNIRFEGIAFADAGWLGPSREGLVDVQANFCCNPAKPLPRDGHVAAVHNEYLKSPANVVCHAAKGIQFERCTFTRLGGAGLDLECGCQDNVVSGLPFPRHFGFRDSGGRRACRGSSSQGSPQHRAEQHDLQLPDPRRMPRV